MKKKIFKIIYLIVGLMVILVIFQVLDFSFQLHDRSYTQKEIFRFKKHEVEYSSLLNMVLEEYPVESCGKMYSVTKTHFNDYGVIIHCLPKYENNKNEKEAGVYVIFPSWWKTAAGSLGGCATGLFWSNAEIPGFGPLGDDINGTPITRKINQNWYAFSYVSPVECNLKNKHLDF